MYDVERLESKMTEIVDSILEKPIENISKSDFDILSAEYIRLKSKIDSEKHNKRMEEMLSLIMSK